MSKGYSSQTKLERLSAEFATIEPIRAEQNGISVNAHVFAYEVGTDIVEASSTIELVNATSHAARKGDIIRFTSGALNNTEVKVWDVSANVIELAEDLQSAPATSVTFQILRPKYPVVNASGELPVASAPVRFNLDGAEVEVTEDTVTPANNIPLPVKLTSVTGDINITAGDLNVHLSAVGVNYDSTRIGDGTNLLGITASNEAKVSVTQPLPAGTNNIGDVDVVSSVLPTGAATSALQTSSEAILTTIDADTGNIVTSVQLLDDTVGTDTVSAPTKGLVIGGHASGTGTQFNIVHVSNVGSMKVDNSGQTQPVSAASLPLPTGAATEATLSSLDGKIPASLTVTSTRLLVDGSGVTQPVSASSLPLPTGASIAAKQPALGTAGTASADVITVQGIASMTAIKVDGSAVTQPVSGTVTTTPSYISVIDLLDGNILDASSTNINGSAGALVQVVASTAAETKALQILDTTGGFIGLYTGAPASEVLRLVIGPGSDQTIQHTIPISTRITVRRLDSTTALSSGFLAINFLG
jgi:hypothetical protein